jgi:hypothetical protein
MDDQPINGNRVELHYGDLVEPLPDHLARLDRELKWNRRGLIVALILLAAHAAIPEFDPIPVILRILGV